MKNQWFSKIAVWMVIAMVLFTVFKQFDGGRMASASHMAYSDFLEEVRNNRVKSATIQEGQGGTDGDNPPEAPFPSLHDELELLAGPVGMPPLEVIRAATATAARALGQQAERGTLEPGKLADFVVLAGDPSRDIGQLRSVTATVKRGVRHPRAEFEAGRQRAE